jgi:predicted aldo/keto reductase-like oxidoreductase
MRQIRGKRPYVSTKCGLGQATTAEEAYAQVQKSRDRLSVDTIEFFHMWFARTPDEYHRLVVPGGIYDGLRRAQQDGLIAHICCSVHMDGAELKDILADGRAEVVTLGYNALNFAYRRVGLQACHDKGLGVVAMNPLSGGVIPRLAEQFEFLKSGPEESVVQAALRFVMGHEEISAALPGPGSIAELEECVAATERVAPVTEETFARLSEHLSSKLNTLCTSCAYCDECPADIPIPKFLDAYNQYLLNPEAKKARGYLKGIWTLKPADAEACIQCGLCEVLCTQRLPIIARLKEIAAWA